MPRELSLRLVAAVTEFWLTDDSTPGGLLNSSGGEIGRTFTSARERGVGQMLVGHGPHTTRSTEQIITHLERLVDQLARVLTLPGERFAVKIALVGDEPEPQLRAFAVTITRLADAENDPRPAA